MTKIELLGKATKREIDFECPECGTRNHRWINKKAEREAEMNIGKVIFYCWTCNAMLTAEELIDD